jgi:hypothetical protein
MTSEQYQDRVRQALERWEAKQPSANLPKVASPKPGKRTTPTQLDLLPPPKTRGGGEAR